MKKSKDDQDNKTVSGSVGDNILGGQVPQRGREESKTIAFSSASDFNDTMVTSEATSNAQGGKPALKMSQKIITELNDIKVNDGLMQLQIVA